MRASWHEKQTCDVSFKVLVQLFDLIRVYYAINFWLIEVLSLHSSVGLTTKRTFFGGWCKIILRLSCHSQMLTYARRGKIR